MDLSTPDSYIILLNSCTANTPNTSKRIERHGVNTAWLGFLLPYMRALNNMHQPQSIIRCHLFFRSLHRIRLSTSRLVIFSPLNPRLHINQNEEREIKDWCAHRGVNEHWEHRTRDRERIRKVNATRRHQETGIEVANATWSLFNGGSKATVHE